MAAREREREREMERDREWESKCESGREREGWPRPQKPELSQDFHFSNDDLDDDDLENTTFSITVCHLYFK